MTISAVYDFEFAIRPWPTDPNVVLANQFRRQMTMHSSLRTLLGLTTLLILAFPAGTAVAQETLGPQPEPKAAGPAPKPGEAERPAAKPALAAPQPQPEAAGAAKEAPGPEPASKPVASEAGKEPAACWTRSALAAQPGEEKIQHKVPKAFVAAPTGTLAPFEAHPIGGAVRRVKLPLGQKLIALTFDLCEQPHEISGYQGTIVDELRRKNIKATFFIGGKWMISHPKRTEQLIADPLFEIGNHTWGHRNLRVVNAERRKTEIEWSQLAYEQTLSNLNKLQCPAGALAHAAPRMHLFRFPYGACSPDSLKELQRSGLVAIQWDVSSGDPSMGLKADAMVRDVVNRVHPGSIVLFHANGRGWQTPSALPGILEQLTHQGYKFVTVSELMAAGEPEVTADCYDSKPADTHRYDALARKLELDYARAEQEVMGRAAAPNPAAATPAPKLKPAAKDKPEAGPANRAALPKAKPQEPGAAEGQAAPANAAVAPAVKDKKRAGKPAPKEVLPWSNPAAPDGKASDAAAPPAGKAEADATIPSLRAKPQPEAATDGAIVAPQPRPAQRPAGDESGATPAEP